MASEQLTRNSQGPQEGRTEVNRTRAR